MRLAVFLNHHRNAAGRRSRTAPNPSADKPSVYVCFVVISRTVITALIIEKRAYRSTIATQISLSSKGCLPRCVSARRSEVILEDSRCRGCRPPTIRESAAVRDNGRSEPHHGLGGDAPVGDPRPAAGAAGGSAAGWYLGSRCKRRGAGGCRDSVTSAPGRPRAPGVDSAGARAGHPWWCSGWCPPAHSAPTCSRGGFQLRFHHLDPLSQSSAPMSTVSRRWAGYLESANAWVCVGLGLRLKSARPMGA